MTTLLTRTMNKENKKIKVLLSLNGDKDPLKSILDRAGVLLRYALEAAGMEYTYDYKDDFDYVHLLSLNQYWAYRSIRKKALKASSSPLILTLFNDPLDLSNDSSQEEADFQKVLEKTYKQVTADKVVCSCTSQALMIKHLNLFPSVNMVGVGAKTYLKEEYSSAELNAFRQYYGLKEKDKVIISYGPYDYSKGIFELESVARVMPEYEFFYFGERKGVLANSKHFGKGNTIPNLHYVDFIPNELYHSMMFLATALFLPYKYHADTVVPLEAMKARVPIISAKNDILFDFLVDKKTSVVCENTDGFYHALKNIEKINYKNSALEFAEPFTPESYGKRLKEIYIRTEKVTELNKNKDE